MLSKWVENIVGKGEIACNEQFLLFPQCFQKACFPGASNGVVEWEWVKTICILCISLQHATISRYAANFRSKMSRFMLVHGTGDGELNFLYINTSTQISLKPHNAAF